MLIVQAPSTRITREQLVKRDDLHAIAPLVTLGLDIEVMTMVRVIRRVWRRVRGCMCVEGVCVEVGCVGGVCVEVHCHR